MSTICARSVEVEGGKQLTDLQTFTNAAFGKVRILY